MPAGQALAKGTYCQKPKEASHVQHNTTTTPSVAKNHKDQGPRHVLGSQMQRQGSPLGTSPSKTPPASESFSSQKYYAQFRPPPPLSQHPAYRSPDHHSHKPPMTILRKSIANQPISIARKPVPNQPVAIPREPVPSHSVLIPRKPVPTRQAAEQTPSCSSTHDELRGTPPELRLSDQERRDRARATMKERMETLKGESTHKEAPRDDSKQTNALWQNFDTGKKNPPCSHALGASPPVSFRSGRTTPGVFSGRSSPANPKRASPVVGSYNSKSSKKSLSTFFKKLVPESGRRSRPNTPPEHHNPIKPSGNVPMPVREDRPVMEHRPGRRKVGPSRLSNSKDNRQTTMGDFMRAGLDIRTPRPQERSQRSRFKMPGIRRKSSDDSLEFKCRGLQADKPQTQPRRRSPQVTKHCRRCGAIEFSGSELCPPCYTEDIRLSMLPDAARTIRGEVPKTTRAEAVRSNLIHSAKASYLVGNPHL